MRPIGDTLEELEAEGLLWDPSFLAGGLRCWLDPMDPSAVTISGSDVTVLRDRAPSTGGTLSRVSDGPTWSANAIGRMPGLIFTASPHERMVGDNFVALTLPMVATAIFQPESGSGNFARYFSFVASTGSDSGSLNSLAMMIRHNNTDVMATWFNGSLRAQTGMANGQLNLCSVTIDASGNIKHYVNGLLGDSNSLGGTPNWSAVKFILGTQDAAGGNGSNNAPANMRFGGGVHYCGPEFEIVHRMLEGHLAWRARRPDLLGGAHQFRSGPPLIGG
jgi:hypothetical protein